LQAESRISQQNLHIREVLLMMITARNLSLTLLGLLSGSLLYASTPVATLTCHSAQGSTVTVAVFQFSLGMQVANLSLDIAALGPLLAAWAANTTYATCTLDNNAASATMSNVTVSFVGATGIGRGFASTEEPETLPALPASQFYAPAALLFGSLTVGGVTTQASKADGATSKAKNDASLEHFHSGSNPGADARASFYAEKEAPIVSCSDRIHCENALTDSALAKLRSEFSKAIQAQSLGSR
jgi:hypothetical protein